MSNRSDSFDSSSARTAASIQLPTRRTHRGLPWITLQGVFPALFIVPWLALPIVLAPSTAEAQTAPACTSANSDGSYTVPFNWALKPSGLTGNTKFRLLFLTSTIRNALATNIATYNTFVQTRAKAASEISDSCGNLFKVVGSTSTVDARDNTSTTGTGEAIYWLKGAKVADNYADFYDGTWDSLIGKTESGANYNRSFVIWTGSNQDGTKRSFNFLGHGAGSGLVRVGSLSSNGNPLSHRSLLASTSGRTSFYALSPVFRWKTSLPCPST